MAKKSGLGKGLDALFATPIIEEEKMQEKTSRKSTMSLILNLRKRSRN